MVRLRLAQGARFLLEGGMWMVRPMLLDDRLLIDSQSFGTSRTVCRSELYSAWAAREGRGASGCRGTSSASSKSPPGLVGTEQVLAIRLVPHLVAARRHTRAGNSLRTASEHPHHRPVESVGSKEGEVERGRRGQRSSPDGTVEPPVQSAPGSRLSGLAYV